MRSYWLRRVVVFSTFALTFCALTASADFVGAVRHVSNRELKMEKSGRVVDADTGTGIPGVKVIVNWRTSSTGVPGYGSGGEWCDLQKIVTTDESGSYTIPDVSKELDIADRGVHVGRTDFGLVSVKHDADYVLAVFKPGYVRVGDLEKARKVLNYARKNDFLDLSLHTTPAVDFQAGKTTIKPISMQKVELSWSDLLAYYAIVPLKCTDRMAHFIESPETTDIRNTMRSIVLPMPCSMSAETPIDALALDAFIGLSHPGGFNIPFYNRVKQLTGLPASAHFDPLERVSTNAGALCNALKGEEQRP